MNKDRNKGKRGKDRDPNSNSNSIAIDFYWIIGKANTRRYTHIRTQYSSIIRCMILMSVVHIFFSAKPSKNCCLFKIRLWWEKSKAKLLNTNQKKLCVCLCSCRTYKVAFVGLMIIVISFLSVAGRVLSVNDIYCTTFLNAHNFGYFTFCCYCIDRRCCLLLVIIAVVVIKHRLQWNSKCVAQNEMCVEYGPIDMLKLNDK